MKKTKVIILATAFYLSCVVSGQDVKSLTWQECQSIAVSNNASLAGYRYSLESARYNYYVSKNQNLPYPGVSLSHSYSLRGSDSSPSSDSFSFNISASETLFSVKSYTDLKIQLKSIEKADLDLRASMADTRKNLLTSFINLLYAQEKIKVAEKVVKIRKRSAEMIDLKYESGRESKGNQMRTAAQLTQAQTDLAQAQTDLLTAQRALALNMGMDKFIAVNAVGELSIPSVMPDVSIDDAALSVISVLQSKKSLEQYGLRLKQAGADIYPTLSASQSVGWTGDNEPPSDSRSWSVGVSLSWPLFSGGPTYYKNSKASARAQLNKAQEDYKYSLLSAKYNLQSALSSLEAGIANIGTANQFLEAARRRNEEAEIQYSAGRMTFQDWQTVEQELVSAEQSVLTKLQNANIARAQIDNLLGIPLGDK